MGSSNRPIRELATWVAVGALLAACGGPTTRPAAVAAPHTPETRAAETTPSVVEAAPQNETGAPAEAAATHESLTSESRALTKVPPAGPCPPRLGEASVWPEETSKGAALVFIGEGSLDELREAVARLAKDYERAAAVAMRAHLDRVHGGIRLVLEPTAPDDVAAVRAYAAARAVGLAQSCPTVELQLVRGEDDEPTAVERGDEREKGLERDEKEDGKPDASKTPRRDDKPDASASDDEDDDEKRKKVDDEETADDEEKGNADADDQDDETDDGEGEGGADGADDSDDGADDSDDDDFSDGKDDRLVRGVCLTQTGNVSSSSFPRKRESRKTW
jgi:hypothetical protein